MVPGAQIVADFVAALHGVPGVAVARTSLSSNVFEVNGPMRCLLYIKGRAEPAALQVGSYSKRPLKAQSSSPRMARHSSL